MFNSRYHWREQAGRRKSQNFHDDFPNLSIITKSTTPGEVQLTFIHATIGNNSLGVSAVAFSLAGNIDSTSVFSIKMDIYFDADSNKIRLPITEVLLCAASGDLVRSKKHQDWTPRNAVLLSPFFAEAAILTMGSP